MFDIFNKTPATPTPLENEISDLFKDIKAMSPETKEYDAASNQLVKLIKLQKETVPSWTPSADVLATCVANILGIVMILNFERFGVVASKALGFVVKLK